MTGHRLTRNRPYLLWLASDSATGLGAALVSFAIPLLALVATDDPTQAGVIAAVGVATRVVATLAGGVLADRHRRLPLTLAGAVTGLALALVFTALTVGSVTFVALLLVNAALALRSGLFGVASESAIKELVPDEAMGRAQAANQARDAVISLAGAPLGGALLVAGGWLVGLGMAVCQSIATVTSWVLVRTAPPGEVRTPREAGPRPSAVREAREGIAWLLSRRDLRGVLLVTTIVNLGFNAATTTTVYALQQDGASTTIIGWVMAALSAALLVGALVAPPVVRRVRAGALLVIGLLLVTGSTVALAFVEDPVAVAVVLAVAVVGIPALNAGLLGYFTVATPSELLGRAISALQVFATGAMPLSPLIAGFGLTWVGRETTLLVAGGLCLAATTLATASRSLRQLPREAEWAAHAARFGDGPLHQEDRAYHGAIRG